MRAENYQTTERECLERDHNYLLRRMSAARARIKEERATLDALSKKHLTVWLKILEITKAERGLRNEGQARDDSQMATCSESRPNRQGCCTIE